MEGKNTSKPTRLDRAGKNNLDSGHAPCSTEQDSDIPTLNLFFYWMLFGQLVLLLLSLFGYESLRPIIDWVSSIIPSIESLRHSERVMNADLARAHYALMWLFSPVLISAALFSPVRQGEREFFVRGQSRSKALFGVFFTLLLVILFPCVDFPTGPKTFGLGSFAIGFAFLSSFFTSCIALPFRYMKLILTDTREEL